MVDQLARDGDLQKLAVIVGKKRPVEDDKAVLDAVLEDVDLAPDAVGREHVGGGGAGKLSRVEENGRVLGAEEEGLGDGVGGNGQGAALRAAGGLMVVEERLQGLGTVLRGGGGGEGEESDP